MYELLATFFSKILNYDVQIQKIDEFTFKVTSPSLEDITYQTNYVSNLLEGYGLNNVITLLGGDPPALLIDFSQKWHDEIERFSYKFLAPNVEHWDGNDLNRYASLVETSNVWEKRTKLASNLLLLYNFYPKKKVKKISLTLEQGKVSQLLTYREDKTSTVFQKISGEVELRSLSPHSNTFKVLNLPLFKYFNSFRDNRGIEVEMDAFGIELDSQYYTEEKLKQVKSATKHVGSLSDQSQKLVSLHQVFTLAKGILKK